MNDAQLDELSAKLDVIVRLLAHKVAQGHDTLETKALALSAAGLRPKEIAVICGTTAASVSVRLAVSKKKSTKRR